jgi:hypothetical protein
MPDLTAGSTVLAQDFPAPESNTQAADEAGFTDTSYTAGANVCGTTFTAPTSGRVLVLWHARFETNTTGVRATVSVEVRTGSSIGSGTVVSAASDASALESISDGDAAGVGTNARMQAGMWRIVSGLTPGDSYNVRTMHRVSGTGSGDIFDRNVAVVPLP